MPGRIEDKNMMIITDDLCLSNLKFFSYFDRAKEKNTDLKVLAFAIANYRTKENLGKSRRFKRWFCAHKDWVDIGVHGYDHLYPPECERDNQENLISMALDILRPFLPSRFLYRAPGFQVTCKTEPILRRLGFFGIAHQTKIKYFDGSFKEDLFNTHCCEKWENPVTKIHLF